ncbi:hypothetical protein BACCIP111883_01448 [Sutcliffiella rhizosphaerae]|uniref:Uncharacterized protein n=2 Tax=Sutcliffiella rhizosphaerae TaxID=2880967 RepID=A0ABN8A6G9_9BACI|nr:hypothetical protein BACCIP111883_01448 [Sutcliffiella rhizosphaerae]
MDIRLEKKWMLPICLIDLISYSYTKVKHSLLFIVSNNVKISFVRCTLGNGVIFIQVG